MLHSNMQYGLNLNLIKIPMYNAKEKVATSFAFCIASTTHNPYAHTTFSITITYGV